LSDLKLTLRLAADGSVLKGELRTASGEVRKFGGQAEQTGARAEKGFGKARKGVESISDSLTRLQRVVGVLAAVGISARAIQSIGRASDLYSNLYAQIGLVTASALQQSDAFDEVLDIANRTGQAMDSVTALATRSIRALESSGESADEATRKGLALTDAISDAVRVSQAPVAQTTAAIIQLSQGLGAGALRGEEFNSVMEQTPRVAQAISDALGVTLGELRELANDGQLTTEVVTNALLSQAATLRAEANDIPRTIAESWRALSNEVTAYIGQASKATGAGETIADSLFAISENLDAVFSALLIAVQALTLAIAGRLVSAIAAWTAANVVLTPSIAGATAATLRLNAALLASVVQMRAIAAATALARGALALLGGPIGAVITGVGLVGLAVAKASDAYQQKLEEMRQPTEELRELIAGLRSEAEQPVRYDIDLSQFEAGTRRIREEIAETQRQLDALEAERAAAIEQAQGPSAQMSEFGGIAAQARAAVPSAELVALRERQEAQNGLLEESIGLYAEAAEGARQFWLEATPEERDAAAMSLLNDGLEWAGSLAELAGEKASSAFEQWRVSVEGAGAANQKLIEPLEEQITKLEQELFVLEAVTAGRQSAAMATLQFQQAEAMAQATTEADKRAIQEKYAELQRLTGEIELARKAQERKTQAERDAEKASRTYRQLLSATNPLVAEQQLLSGQLEMLKELAGLSATELQALRVDAELLTEMIAGLEGELNGLGSEGGFFPFGEGEDFIALMQDAVDKMEELADIEWNLEGLLNSFHPLADQMRRLGAEIGLIDKALSEGLIGNAEAGFMKIGASANAAFDAMMAGVDQTSKEYKALELAQQATNVALGIAAILQQGMGDPYTAIPRMIAMAAMVAQLVGSIGSFGGGSTNHAANQQAIQGTGTVLGDEDANSASIARATELTADATRELVGINRGMLRALQALQQGIAGASGLLARGAGDAAFSPGPSINTNAFENLGVFGDILGLTGPLSKLLDPLNIFKFIGKLLGGSSKVTDQGIEILGGTLADLLEGTLVGAFRDIKFKKWRFGSTRRRSEFVELDAAIAAQFELIFDSIAAAVLEGALALGLNEDEIQRAIDEYQVAAQRISLMDLTAEEQQAELESVFSSIFDGLAGAVVPFIDQFQQVGEGLGSTLIRVATGVQVTQEAVKRLGFALDETDPEKFAQASEGLITLLGGVDEFIAGMTGFVDRFASDAVKARVAYDDITRGLDQVALTLPPTRDGFWELMQSLDATTEAGREQIAMLLKLTDAADVYYRTVESIQQEREGLERRLLQLQGDTAALRELELAGLDESNRELQKRIWALEDEQAATAELDQLKRRLLQLQGDTAALRELELAGLDESNRELQKRIWALEDEQAATAELNQLMAGIEDTISGLSFSPLVNETRALIRTQIDLMKRLRELDATEEQLGRSRVAYSMQVAELASRLEQNIRSLVDQFLGRDQSGFGTAFGSSFSAPIENAANSIRDALIRALEGVDEWLRRSAFEDPSLTPRQRFAALQAEFDRLVDLAINGSGQAQVDAIAALPQLASQLEAMGVRMYGSATETFGDLRAQIVAAMEQVAGITVLEAAPDPVTGAQVGAIQASAEQVAAAAEAQRIIAAQILEEIGALVALNRGTAEEIAEQLGVPLADVIQSLIGSVDESTLETVAQLLAVADTLGMDLTDVAAAIDLNIGQLADQSSLFSQALQDAVLRLPEDIQHELWDPLRRVWEATSEADANAAIEDLKAATELLPDKYKNLLAPFIEGIDPTEPLTVQIGLLEQLRALQGEQVLALDRIHEILDRIGHTIGAQNEADGLPGFAAGGWVNSNQVIRAGEAGRELILPNPVSEFFARAGIPVVTAASSAESAAELNRIASLIEAGNKDRQLATDRLEAAQITVARSMDEAAREARSMTGIGR